MKIVIRMVVLMVGLLHAPSVVGQTYTGNLTLASQAQVNAFNYTEVTGYLQIEGNDITDLTPLAPLTRVGGDLGIEFNAALITVNGFGNLAHVGGGLNVYKNPNLVSLAGFAALAQMGGTLYIGDNTALITVDGFNSLTNVGQGLLVYDNTNLVSFAGFAALQETGDNIDFWYNNSLVTISGFNSLHTVGWTLEIGGNPLLTQIPAFESLRTITSSLYILDNDSLTRIYGFDVLQSVGWSFNIYGNAALRNLSGFYDFLSRSNQYTGGGAFNIKDNHSYWPNPTTFQNVINAGPRPDRCAITSISFANADQCVLTWQAARDATYTLQYCEDLSATPLVWTSVPGFIDLPGPLVAPWSFSGTNTGVALIPRRFYRVRFSFP